MKSTDPMYLLDLNALISLADPDAIHHSAMHRWFDGGGGKDWGVCPLTEAGFIRVTTNPQYRGPQRTVAQAAAILAEFSRSAGYHYWPIPGTWSELTAPFASRILGHQQVTDAYLLGIAIRQKGILVTFDRAITYMAGTEFHRHLMVLQGN
ncbi:MAG: TA system VapC family ribonuclease toxin [Acidobacteriota bacterium]